MNYQDFIIRDPKTCGGQPVIHGTRVTLRPILASLAAGDSVADIVRDFPTLTEETVHAVIAVTGTPGSKKPPTPPPGAECT